jgi:hypothetical protein
MLAAGLIKYHEVGEDVNVMITAADVSGPVALCDSAISLMMHLLHVRVTEVPGASLLVCQHVIRWLFARWNPGMYLVMFMLELNLVANIYSQPRGLSSHQQQFMSSLVGSWTYCEPP